MTTLHRVPRPHGFQTMVNLGYMAEGLSIALLAAFIFTEVKDGHILSSLMSSLNLCLSIASIALIYLMAKKKKIFALQAIRVYLWASIPYAILSGIAAAQESSDAANLAIIPISIVIGTPIALYWQRRNHYIYLKSCQP